MGDLSYITRYQKANTTQVNIRLSYKYEADMVDWMSKIESELDMGKATYIKKLIREDMKKRGIKTSDEKKEV